MKKILFVLGGALLLAQAAQAWQPSGWVYANGAYAYDHASRDWYWFRTGDVQWAHGYPPANGWQRLEESGLAQGWSYHTWPYAYDFEGGAWYFFNQRNAAWCINLRTRAWSLFGAPPFSSGVILKTSKGDITLRLFPFKAPVTVRNFMAYVDSGFYADTVFHRVIHDFMIQGGGFDRSLNLKATRPPIKNEAANGLSNLRGTIAMARTDVVDSATSQFFINVVDNPFLDHGVRDYGYCVFGRVVAGMDKVDAIKAVDVVQYGSFTHLPWPAVILESVERWNE